MTPGAPPSRGTLLQNPPQLLSTLTISSLLTELELPINALLLSVSSAPLCDIVFYHIEYETVGGAGEATTASAVLMIPTGLGSNCTGARPFVLYAHGTTTDRAYNMADLQNPKQFLWRRCSHLKATSWSRRTMRVMTPRPCRTILI